MGVARLYMIPDWSSTPTLDYNVFFLISSRAALKDALTDKNLVFRPEHP